MKYFFTDEFKINNFINKYMIDILHLNMEKI